MALQQPKMMRAQRECSSAMQHMMHGSCVQYTSYPASRMLKSRKERDMERTSEEILHVGGHHAFFAFCVAKRGKTANSSLLELYVGDCVDGNHALHTIVTHHPCTPFFAAYSVRKRVPRRCNRCAPKAIGDRALHCSALAC